MQNSEDIITKIEDDIQSRIEAMTLSGGYYFDWTIGTVNDQDIARQTFPSAEVMIDEEESQDSEDGSWNQIYTNHCRCMIRVRVENDDDSDTPAYAINRELNRALCDLKKLFGVNYSITDQCVQIMYRRFAKITDLQNDIMRPKYMDTEWLIRYGQYRTDPSVFSS